MDCVEVCPVDCFYEGENMLVIHPDECIDCGVCEPECPVDAIKPDTVPGLGKREEKIANRFPWLCPRHCLHDLASHIRHRGGTSRRPAGEGAAVQAPKMHPGRPVSPPPDFLVDRPERTCQ